MVQQTSILSNPVEQNEIDENETINEKLRLVPHDDEDQGIKFSITVSLPACTWYMPLLSYMQLSFTTWETASGCN